MTENTIGRRRSRPEVKRLLSAAVLITVGMGVGFGAARATDGVASIGGSVAATTPDQSRTWLEYRAGERANLAPVPFAGYEIAQRTPAGLAAWLAYRAGEREPLATPSNP